MQPDTFYHVYNRGINGEDVFKVERNYSYFLQKYDQFVSPIADPYAYCLMKNHFHLLIKTKSEEEIRKSSLGAKPSLKSEAEEKPIHWLISNAFASLFKSYAQAINKAHQRTGGLFEEPFQRIAVNSDAYFSWLVYYIHFNPQKHGFIDDYRMFPHSSYSSISRKTNKTETGRSAGMVWRNK